MCIDMAKVYVEVTIKYRDDKVEKFKCSDTPGVNPDWITIYPLKEPLSRIMTPREGVASVSWRYLSK